jgi:thioredoxin-dependent peroxiredoxin
MANLGTTPKQQQLVQAAAAIGYALQREDGDNFFRMPADILIGPDQRIKAAFYADILGDHLELQDIEHLIQSAA